MGVKNFMRCNCKECLINDVIKQIKLDVEFPDNDLTALELLLSRLSRKVLKSYLPEEFYDEFDPSDIPLPIEEINRDE